MLNYTSIRLTCVHCNLNCRNSQNYFIGSLDTLLWYLLLIKFPVLSWDHHSALKHVYLSLSLQLFVQNTNVNINFLQFPIRTNSAIMLRTKSRTITSEDRMDALLSDCPSVRCDEKVLITQDWLSFLKLRNLVCRSLT